MNRKCRVVSAATILQFFSRPESQAPDDVVQHIDAPADGDLARRPPRLGETSP